MKTCGRVLRCASAAGMLLALAAPVGADDFVNVPIVVNILKGAGFTEADAKSIVDRASEIYKQAKVKFTLVKTNKDVEIGNGDANLTKAEGDTAKKKGEDELKASAKKKGIKIYLTNDPWVEEPGTNGWAVHKNPVVFIPKNPTGANDAEKLRRTGNSAAHEMGHVLTLPDRYTDATKDQLMYGRDSRTDTKLTAADITEVNGEAKKRAAVEEKPATPAPSTPKAKEIGIGIHTETTVPAIPEFQNITMAMMTAEASAPLYDFRLTLGDVIPNLTATQQFLYLNTDSNPGTGITRGGVNGLDLEIQLQSIGGAGFVTGQAIRLSGPPLVTPLTGTLIDELKFKDPDLSVLPEGGSPPVDQPYQSVIDFSLPKSVFGLTGSPLFDVVVMSGNPLSPFDQFVMQFDRADATRGPQLASTTGMVNPAAPAMLDLQGSQYTPNEFVDVFLDSQLLTTLQASPTGLLTGLVALPPGLAANSFYFVTGLGQTSAAFDFLVVETVPEPAPVWLAALGCVLVGWWPRGVRRTPSA